MRKEPKKKTVKCLSVCSKKGHHKSFKENQIYIKEIFNTFNIKKYFNKKKCATLPSTCK